MFASQLLGIHELWIREREECYKRVVIFSTQLHCILTTTLTKNSLENVKNFVPHSNIQVNTQNRNLPLLMVSCLRNYSNLTFILLGFTYKLLLLLYFETIFELRPCFHLLMSVSWDSEEGKLFINQIQSLSSC